jgi:hypothetical protein
MSLASDKPANAFLFAPPELEKQLKFASAGMLSPSVETLSPQRYASLYRLGHSNLSDDENLSSPWWSDFQSFNALRKYAETNSISLTMASRIHNAQTAEFGPADTLFKVSLHGPVMVFQGLGRPMMGLDNRIYSPPHAVTQTFIPGLRDWPRRARSKLWSEIFRSYSSEMVPKGLISLYGD